MLKASWSTTKQCSVVFVLFFLVHVTSIQPKSFKITATCDVTIKLETRKTCFSLAQKGINKKDLFVQGIHSRGRMQVKAGQFQAIDNKVRRRCKSATKPKFKKQHQNLNTRGSFMKRNKLKVYFLPSKEVKRRQ